MAANLYLPVPAADVEEPLPRQSQAQVPRAIEHGGVLGSERILQESCRRQVRATEITGRHAGAPDADLSCAPVLDRLQAIVEEVHVEVGNRLTDRTQLAIEVRSANFAIGHVYRRLGNAVHVDEPRPFVPVTLAPFPQRGRNQSLAAENDPTEGGRRSEILGK